MHGKTDENVAADSKFQGVKNVVCFTVLDVNAERLEWFASFQLT